MLAVDIVRKSMRAVGSRDLVSSFDGLKSRGSSGQEAASTEARALVVAAHSVSLGMEFGIENASIVSL